jgi:hypothetical protein
MAMGCGVVWIDRQDARIVAIRHNAGLTRLTQVRCFAALLQIFLVEFLSGKMHLLRRVSVEWVKLRTKEYRRVWKHLDGIRVKLVKSQRRT